MSRIKEIVLVLWQFPQLILGLIFKLVLSIKYNVIKTEKYGISYYSVKGWKNGISLSPYFIFLDDDYYGNVTIKHESGHAQQSKRLGIFYLIIIGLPSISGNIFDRLFHKKWEPKKRILWYYNLPWEKWADSYYDIRRG